jgi:hypothetical protein
MRWVKRPLPCRNLAELKQSLGLCMKCFSVLSRGGPLRETPRRLRFHAEGCHGEKEGIKDHMFSQSGEEVSETAILIISEPIN